MKKEKKLTEEEKMNEESVAIIKESLEPLANLCLYNSGNKTEYSNQDLLNVTLIFMEIFSNKMYDHFRPIGTDEQLEELFETHGKFMREMLIDATGVDMHDEVKNSVKK